jgi:hypothetical protein
VANSRDAGFPDAAVGPAFIVNVNESTVTLRKNAYARIAIVFFIQNMMILLLHGPENQC